MNEGILEPPNLSAGVDGFAAPVLNPVDAGAPVVAGAFVVFPKAPVLALFVVNAD